MTPALELIGCATCHFEDVTLLLAHDRPNVVVIDSSQSWAADLVRALRTQRPHVKTLILADPARLLGYILYDVEHFIENAGEDEVIGAIQAAGAGRSLLDT